MNIRRAARWFLTSAAIFLFLLFFADHIILPHFTRPPENRGILFPPGSEFPYQTPEFSHTAKINALGFRDREWVVERSPRTVRILAIGDSFTFGMGVELDQTWPKIVEKRLREKGYNVEIANLGSAGADPGAYLKVAQRAIPLLNPDIILVAILQGDDLAQILRKVRKGETGKIHFLSSQLGMKVKLLAQYIYPHTFRIITELSASRPTFRSKERLLENIWKEQAAKLINRYSGEKRERFESISETAKDMFMTGHLNPALVNMAVNDPQYFLAPLQVADPDVKNALRTIQEHLQEIKINAGNAELIVLSIPLGAYISENILQSREEMGFATRPDMLYTTTPDHSLKKICDEVGLPLISVTEQFRAHIDKSFFYYKYDGHFTARGHEVYSELLFPILEEHIFSGRNR